MSNLREKFRSFQESFGLRLLKFAYPLSQGRARLLLNRAKAKVLIDNSTLGHAVYAENFRVEHGNTQWGELSIPSSEYRTLPVFDLFSDEKLPKEVSYLFPITQFISDGLIDAYTSRELELEALRQPKGRFFGYSRTDKSLFSEIRLSSVDGYLFRPLETAFEQSERLKKAKHQLYDELLKFFPEKDSLDVWHIVTCEQNGLSTFLTFDFRFIQRFSEARLRKGFPEISAEPMCPSQFAKAFEIQPLNPILLEAAMGQVDPDSMPFEGLNKRESHRFTEEKLPEELFSMLPEVKSIDGIQVDVSFSKISLQYTGIDDRKNQITMDLNNAIYLLSLLKCAQLQLDIPFPDDPRNPNAPAIKPSERTSDE